MLCQICNKNPATIHVQEIINGEKKVFHLCAECAAKKAETEPILQSFNLAEMLYNFASENAQENTDGAEEPVPVASVKCAACGWDTERFRKTGRLGCPDCYLVFSEVLSGVLENMHRGCTHLGKVPRNHETNHRTEDAIEKAREWAQMDKAASERSFFGLGRKRDTDRATEEDIRETVAFKEDSRMIKRTRLFTKGATSLVESLASTQALYEREEKNIEEAYDIDEIQQEIDENNEEIDRMIAKFTVGHMKIKNGEIRKESAEGQQIMRYSAYVVKERARLIERNTRLAGDIERNRQRRSIAKRSLDNVKDLLRELRTYQTRPAVFAVAAERLGIERLQLYIAGNMSSKEREEFISGVLQLRAWSVAETNRQQKEAEELENTTRLTDEYLHIEEPQPVVTQIEPNFEESYEQLANEIEGMQSTPQTQTTDEQEELLRNGGKKAFSDDEM